ncbi:bifunctional diaminohydroxyphosphoribosylaminopyrimidine deaminase/5-amino-6-(5-phosphoribosylamino)uracil reductase RibD [Desulfurobacterium atlanticum]|uniref:Riboflavin biosynthesis protein RibD n=1 Tax=Desulfurobacterium atlanticum TaxID=240169 RepID=A0A239ABG1_9BACT|nr:bifunctional diaminohydroxyphosphoribosylaminopyrimidine deaminase/5-amino-6-(5-phosphoribosylamino)uracil reductase RibD [Desulfurobacterium atlanticum]SNR92930.1 diaminohydroxyphosphoribosylaminopyrimidine deaminase [Desulfurobacterium atlanticum]
MNDDRFFMELAIEEAYKGKGKTLPNPAVGAVVVKNGKVVASGFHEKYGGPHAEAVAIERAGEDAKGATLYVTLEPCNHYGKTPPCTEKIISAGIERVIVGLRDPNPVATGGVERLKEAGIKVSFSVCEKECFELIDDFYTILKTDRAFCSLKLASTLDGKIARKDGSSKWITGEKARRLVHRLRSFHHGVMVGISTVLKDDPLLNVRYISSDRQPKAIVVDGKLKIPVHSKLVKERAQDLIVITSQESLLSYKSGILKDFGVTLLPVYDRGGVLDLEEALIKLRKELGIYSVMCEGGSILSAALIDVDLVDKFYFFYAPKLFGEGVDMLRGFSFEKSVSVFSVEAVGEDFLVKGYSENLKRFLR